MSRGLSDNNEIGQETVNNLIWLAASFVLPLVSPNFYHTASRRKLRYSALFFAILMFSVSTLTILSISFNLNRTQEELIQAYDQNSIPVIIIENGITVVQGDEPVVFIDGEGALFAADTKGTIKEIDKEKYITGILLTKRDLHILNNTDYQIIPLTEIHEAFGTDQILIDKSWIMDTMGSVISIIVIFFSGAVLLWNFPGRIIYLLLLSGLIYNWLDNSENKPNFKVVFSMGLYASLPSIFFSHLFGLIGFQPALLQSILLVTFWGIGIYISNKESEAEPSKINYWLGFLGYPMIIINSLYVIYLWPGSDRIILWLSIGSIVLITILDNYLDSKTKRENISGS